MDSQNSEDSAEFFHYRGNLKPLSDSDSSEDEDIGKGRRGERSGSEQPSTAMATTPTSKRVRESERVSDRHKVSRNAPDSQDLPLEMDQWGIMSSPSPQAVRNKARTAGGAPVVCLTDLAAAEVLRKNREAMQRLQSAAAANEVEDLSDDDPASQDSAVQILEDENAEGEGATVLLVLRTKSNEQLQFPVPMNAPLGELFAKFCACDLGVKLSAQLKRPAKFFFDGELLKESQTPAGCDMEDRDLIDVN